MNILNLSPVVAVWAGSLVLLCFAGGLLLKRKWIAALTMAVGGPAILLPMAFTGGLGALALGEIVVRGALHPAGLGAGAGPWVHGIADAVMLITPFAMLTLYVRYELAFNRAARARVSRASARSRKRTFALGNAREVPIPLRKNSAPRFILPRRPARHHRRTGKRVNLPKLPRRLARHAGPSRRPVLLPHSRGE